MQTSETFARLARDRLRDLAREKEEREAAWNHSLHMSFDRVLVALEDVIERYPYVGPVHDHPVVASSWWTVQVRCGQPLTTFLVQAAPGGHLGNADREVVARSEDLLRAFLRGKGFQADVHPSRGVTIRLPVATETDGAATTALAAEAAVVAGDP